MTHWRFLRALPLIAVAVAGAAAGAQAPRAEPRFEPPGPVAQIAPASTPAEDIRQGQIGPPTREVATGVAAAPRDARPAPQLGMPGDAAAPAQLVREGRSGRGPAQLSDGPRSAQAPAPLSTPAEGRSGAVARVDGRDRCDPAAAAGDPAPRPVAAAIAGPARKARRAKPGSKGAGPRAHGPAATAAGTAFTPPEGCGAVIETRSAEFPPPRTEPLSPEQRLLVEQRPLSPGAGAESIARTASRRIGRDGADATAADMQGLASVVLAPPPVTTPATPEPTDGLTAEQAAIVTNVIGAIQSRAQ